MKHTIACLVENHSGVLARISGLFSARGFNIDSLAVGTTTDPSVSRMTIVTRGDEKVLEQIIKQLNKVVDVIKVADMTTEETIDRELILVKVNTTTSTRSDIMQITNTFRAKIVDVSPNWMTLESTGTTSKVDAMLELLQPYGIREIARTGLISVARRTDLSSTGKKGQSKKIAKEEIV
ncbi:MAG: acetolactate synthase small subunit [Candidatus Omnitrophica bacterium]|nr:acetolactate synthase small subunit [Candidatus Omnitrophota bacterium]